MRMSSRSNTIKTETDSMAQINIIPYPLELERNQGFFLLDAETRTIFDPANEKNAHYLRELLTTATGFPLEPAGAPSPDQNLILLGLDPHQPGEESYNLSIVPERIQITAQTPTGIFYAIQTLRQLLPPEIESGKPVSGVDWQIPCLEIRDQPQYPWRGYMLDESRHFHGISVVKRMLDQMALLKLNRFHWHLTDDQGWRIEIKQYPKLVEVGSRRDGTVTSNPFFSKKHDGQPHHGFYTQDEVREVVQYAAERHIMVIPEIEIPGHSSAALAAYPEFSCTGEQISVQTRFGIFPDIYCAGKPAPYKFLKNVLAEIVDLFPAPFIHIGGDEAPKKRWRDCPDCQQMIRDQNLKNENALQVYLTNQIADYLAGLGKRIIFWSDSFDPNIDPSAIVHFWIGNQEKVIESVRQGRQMISSPYLHAYLDHTYATLPLKNTYHFDPTLQAPQDARGHVLGIEGLMWAEWLPNYRRVEYQTFPRLISLAETAWRSQPLPYEDFLRRLKYYLERLDQFDIGYAPLRAVQPSWIKRLMRYIHIGLPKRGTSLELLLE